MEIASITRYQSQLINFAITLYHKSVKHRVLIDAKSLLSYIETQHKILEEIGLLYRHPKVERNPLYWYKFLEEMLNDEITEYDE